MKYANLASKAHIPQNEPLDKRQVQNNAGGYVYQVGDILRLERFLILGSEGNTYYQNARKLTRENAAVVERCWEADPMPTGALIATISRQGRAPKNDPAIFALALGAISKNPDARRAALAYVPIVCRTGTHLFQFVSAAMALGRGFGRGMKRAVANWYLGRSPDDLAYQVVKYRSRENLTHANLLDLSHPKVEKNTPRWLLGEWVHGRFDVSDAGSVDALLGIPRMVIAHEMAMRATKASELLPVIHAHPDLPWEGMPTWARADADVQRELIPNMGLTALIRNLGNLTRIGAISPLGPGEIAAAMRILDGEAIRKSRVHPMQILTAAKIYASGSGMRGSGEWSPSRPILDALDHAFYAAFENVAPTGKRFMLALDFSGSMGQPAAGSMSMNAREIVAAMSLVTMRTEIQTHVVGFGGNWHVTGLGIRGLGADNKIVPLDISPRQRLSDVVRAMERQDFGRTDCALPMLYALEHRIPVDAFVIYTDNETWSGPVHPMQALYQYRKTMGIDSKLVCVGVTATDFTIGDPQDPGTLNVAGFDTAVPALIRSFVEGS